MKKQDLLALANKGKTEIHGFSCEVTVKPCLGDPFLTIKFDPLSPLHRPLVLGQKWVEDITDEDCDGLEEALKQYKAEADAFCEEAKTVIKATMNEDGTYRMVDIPEKVKEKFKDYPSAFKSWSRQRFNIRPIKDSPEAWYAPGNYTLDLDGVLYVPHWSYWLNCPYYLFKEDQNA